MFGLNKPVKKREPSVRLPMVSRAYTIGDRVHGIRSPNAYAGELVETYVTINDSYRNPAYVVKCDIDGKNRSFQCCRKESEPVNKYIVKK